MPLSSGDHVLLSCERDSYEVVNRIKKSLDESGYKTWMDVDETQGTILQKMAEGVGKASLIVIAMTKKYETSTSCISELQYSQEKRKKIIPIKLERSFKPTGVLGLIVAGARSVDFSDPSRFKESMCSLKKEIDSVLEKMQSSPLPPTAQNKAEL